MLRPSRHPLASAFTPLVAVALAGCRGCTDDHPYVPPANGPSVRAGTDAGASTVRITSEERDGGLAVAPALVAPPDTTSWRVSGMTLEAGGRELVLALVHDFDGDGASDALAIVRPPASERKPGSATGEVVFFRGGGAAGAPPAAIATGPALGAQPSCAPIARLERMGVASAFAEIGFACAKGPGARAIAVIRLPRPGGAPFPAVSFDASVIDPAGAPTLTIDADAVDRDRDGIDDTVLRLTVESDGLPRLGAKLAFFDRPAGPSRDPEEPEASLRTVAAQAVARASKAKDTSAALGLVAQMRALYRAMCSEGGAPRIAKIHGGSATPCGSSKALEDAAVAEVRAFVLQGDALRAFAAAESAQVAPAAKTAAKSAELAKLLAEVAPVVTASGVRTLGAMVDTPHDQHPEWGPLAFEHSGKLLVRYGKTVLRVDPETGEGDTADMVAWKDEVVSPDGSRRFLEAYHACEGVALHATFAPLADGDMADVVLPIAPRLGKACNGARGDGAPAIPIAWGARGLEALVAGQPVLIRLDPPAATPLSAFLDEPPPTGSPRSHGAHAFAHAVSQGVLVRGRTKERWGLLRSPDLEPYSELRRCTTPDDASRVACVRRGKVVLAAMP